MTIMKMKRIICILTLTFGSSVLAEASAFGADDAARNAGVNVQFDRFYNNMGEYTNEQAAFCAVDADGNTLWSYTTGEYQAAQLPRIKEIGLYNDTYFYCEDGTITARNAATGDIIWENGDFGGSPSGWDFDEEGNLYICGSLGPYLFVVSKEGTTLLNDPYLDINYFEPAHLEVEDINRVKINFIGGPEYREEGFDIIVKLRDTGSYDGAQKVLAEYYDADQEAGREYIEAENYDEIIQKYKTAIEESWAIENRVGNGLNYLCRFDELDQIGYVLRDINGDGTDELMIGRLEEDSSWGMGAGMFYDLYTMKDDKPVLVVQSAERDRYNLCSDGSVAEEGSGGADSSFEAYYGLESGATTLTLKEAVIYAGYFDEENPWFYSTTSNTVSSGNPEAATRITREEADTIRNQYTYASMDATPLSQM